MAWTELLPSGKYRGGYRNNLGRKRYTQPYDLKRQALADAKTREGEPDTTPNLPHEGNMPTWGEWVPEWRKRRRLVEDNTALQDEYRIKNYLNNHWFETPLDKITSSDVQAWVNMLTVEKGLAPSTVQKCKALLSSTLKAAVMNDLIPKNPCTGVILPKIPPTPDRYLTDDECNLLLTVLDGKDADAFEFLIGTGIRPNEFHAAHHDQNRGKHFHVNRAYVPRYHYMKPPKTYAVRDVPMTERVQEIVSRMPDLGPVQNVEYRAGTDADCGLLFPNAQGNPWVGPEFLNTLKAAAKAVGIRPVGVQDLRHTYGTRLVQRGVDIYTVKDLMGHAVIQTTMRYARLADSQWDKVRKALES